MLALLLSLSNPETGWQEEMALEDTAVIQTSYHLPSVRATSSFFFDQFAQIKISDLIWSQLKELWLRRPKPFCWRIISRELFMQPTKKPDARYSRNTLPNLPLPSRRSQVPCKVTWKYIIHLTHRCSFFSLFIYWLYPCRWCESLFHLPFNECHYI